MGYSVDVEETFVIDKKLVTKTVREVLPTGCNSLHLLA